MAKKSQNFVTSSGYRSFDTMDLGFPKCFSPDEILWSSILGRDLGVATGI